MKIFLMLLTMFFLFSCTSKEPKRDTSSWSGAQRQEAIQDETQNQQQERLRNQFPGERSF